MIALLDIHTHHLPQLAGEAILNCYPDTFIPEVGGWYSVGVHPWHVTASAGGRYDTKTLLPLLKHSQVLAVGEAGLDKLADAPMPLQVEIFEWQARMAMEIDKPVIIHLVKAVDELLKLKETIRPTNPWIIHGFRGKAILAEEYLRHGFYLSFGEKYQVEALRIVPSDRLFLETDESTVPIAELYKRAAEVRRISCDELLETISENIGKVFFKR